MEGVKQHKNVLEETKTDEDSRVNEVVWFLDSIERGATDIEITQQKMNEKDADGDVKRSERGDILKDFDLPNNVTICSESSMSKGLGPRRCSSAICLSKKDQEDIQAVRQQGVVRLRLNDFGSESYIHRKSYRQASLSRGRSSVPASPCLKTATRRNRTLDEEVISFGSTNKVSFMDRFDKADNDQDEDDDVFLETGTEASNLTVNCNLNPRGCPTLHGQIKDNFILILSGLYGMLLVVIGVVFPMAEIFVYPVSSYVFDVFYIYLFVVSMLFLMYVYVFLLHHGSLGIRRLTSTLSLGSLKKRKVIESRPMDICSTSTLNTVDTATKLRKRRITFNETTNTGSFYLRLGAVGFGIGSMILDGLYFGQYFDSVNKSESCNDAMQAIKPISKLLFTFTQTYFIFLNSKMKIFKNTTLARFGLMHMSATNICVWIRVIVVETLHNIHEADHEKNHTDNHATTYSTHDVVGINISKRYLYNQTVFREYVPVQHKQSLDIMHLPELSCQMSELLGRVLVTASPVLYPFCIEYSLICAAILYVMWQNVGTKRERAESEYIDEEDNDYKRRHRMSVDCAGSSRGLFLGIMLLVASIVLSITFYVMMDNSDEKRLSGVLLANIGETVIYLLATISVVVAALRMRDLKFSSTYNDPLEENLILISMTGIYMFNLFSLIPGFYYYDTVEGFISIITDIAMIFQATLQTMFIFAALRMSAARHYHVQKKPGREFVTFLLLCNFALWGINTFQTQLPSHNPAQIKLYGPKAWAIFTHISVPLGIFYRFHSTVCFSHVWKHAWKRRKPGV